MTARAARACANLDRWACEVKRIQREIARALPVLPTRPHTGEKL